MSEAEAIRTPVRNAQEVVERIGNNTQVELGENGSLERSEIQKDVEVRRSYQDWNESPIQDTKATGSKKKSKGKKKTKKPNYEHLIGRTPSRVLESATKPVLSQTKSVRTPLNGNRTSHFSKTNLEKEKKTLEKVFSDDPECENYENLAISTQSAHENHTEDKFYESKNSMMSNYEMIQQVDQGKEDIHSKKQKLKDLEEEILQISDKMTSYQDETNLIISDLQQRISEREEINQKIKEEPMFYTMNGNQQPTAQNGYSTSDELIGLLNTGIDKKNKKFFNSCKEDLKSWKSIVGQEIKAFNQFLQLKHKALSKDMADEIESFTPVLNGKFEAK